MSRKLTYDYVKSFIESTGYTLLSDTYTGSYDKLLVRCSEGHEYVTRLNSFQQGKRCPTCNKNNFTYDYVKSFIESTGYTLLSDTYTNRNTKLLVKCPEGHEYNVMFGNFKAGTRCPTCNGGIRLTFDYVKSFIESTGYTLLSGTYKNEIDKILIKCPEGHEYNASFSNFKAGTRCPTCNGGIRLTYEHVKSFIESTGYTLLSDTYKNSVSKIVVRCPKEHEYGVTYGNFQSGQRCGVCSGKKKHTHDHVKSVIEADNSTILLDDKYIHAHSKLMVKCVKNNHEYSVSFTNFRKGSRCPLCSNNVSKGESELVSFLKSLNINFIRNDRTQIINPLTGYNLELDVWMPLMKKAIEYNGLYYHSMMDRRKCDIIKQEQCKQLGINLLIVTDYNWLNNNDFERQKIKMWMDAV